MFLLGTTPTLSFPVYGSGFLGVPFKAVKGRDDTGELFPVSHIADSARFMPTWGVA
jgi:hypothetical protein